MIRRKILFAVILIFFALSIVGVSAFSLSEEYKEYPGNYDIWYYKEDLHGHNQGFTLRHYYSSPSHSYSVSYDSNDDVEWNYYSPYGRRENYYSYRNRDENAVYAAFSVYGARRYRGYYGSYGSYGRIWGSYYGSGGYVRNYW